MGHEADTRDMNVDEEAFLEQISNERLEAVREALPLADPRRQGITDALLATGEYPTLAGYGFYLAIAESKVRELTHEHIPGHKASEDLYAEVCACASEARYVYDALSALAHLAGYGPSRAVSAKALARATQAYASLEKDFEVQAAPTPPAMGTLDTP